MVKLSPDSLEFLLQIDVIQELLPKIGKEQWQTLYLASRDSSHQLTVWCAFLDEEAVDRAILDESWDLTIGDGTPTFCQKWSDGKSVTTYHRFGNDSGVRPLVLHRSFHDAFPQYVEVDEEFRLYHDLAEDKKRGLLLSFDTSGREIEVVRIKSNEVRALLKHLRQFQAAIGLHLAIYVDSVRYSLIPFVEIPSNEKVLAVADGLIRWRRDVVKCMAIEEFETFSRLLGKVIIPPPAQNKTGAWPFTVDDDKKEVAFIIGVDENGDEIEHSSKPSKLNNYYDANPEAENYMKPVYFRREVLGKYYAEPERYRVLDGQLSCLNIWSCQIDNDLDSYIAVYLGDLGRYMPYEERLHWRQYNVVPEGRISETNFRRSFLAQAVESQSADLTFRREYTKLLHDWKSVHGWSLFLPSSQGDVHLLDTVRIPVTNSQPEFDEQIGHLSKLLVDSLNEKCLIIQAGMLEKDTKGISKLDSYLESTNFPERQSVVQFLRNLQNFRSSGSAHRKGSRYEEHIARLGIDMTRKADVIRELLEKATIALRSLRIHHCGKDDD
ncbi:MAG: hypothetical protein ACOY15_07140 [Pseudomonadota bacterium]